MATKKQDEPVQESASTAIQSFTTEDVLKDLLKAQQDSVSGDLDLPRIKIVAGGIGLYEFPDEEETVKEFSGVILGAHGKNVLWTKKMEAGARVSDDEDQNRPACSSSDGKWGNPQEGFQHAALKGAAADGTELIECASCPYNKFGSGDAFIPDKNKKGKAVTNQKVVYIYLPDRALPFQLTLNTMSISGYDEYVQKLLRRQIPTLAVMTTFRQVRKEAGSVKWSIATFAEGAPLAKDAFDDVLSMYRSFRDRIEPAPRAARALAVIDTPKADPTLEEEPEFTVESVAKIPAEPVGADKPPF